VTSPAGDRLIRLLALLAVLLFVGSTRFRRGVPYRWERWARWGAIAVFSAAFLYALGAVLLWLFAVSR
jgi:hypothetical protein